MAQKVPSRRPAATGTILDEIVRRRLPPTSAQERNTVNRRLSQQAAKRRASPRPFEAALRAAAAPAIIAELKRSSPSRGRMRADFDVAALAAAYERAGATALSVLTEPNYFEGDLDFLRRVRAASRLPVLRKDFLTHTFQVYESALAGADAVLLIAALLSNPHLGRMLRAAREAGVEALVEVHTREELERVARLRLPFVLGVNSRDLRDFSVSLERAEALSPLLPAHRLSVAESGLHAPADLARMARAGYHAYLMGESFMRAPDPGAALAQLRAGCRRPFVKICGLTNVRDAIHACQAGADAVGFVFAERSPRHIAPERVKSITAVLPAHVQRVGVFAGHSLAAVLAIAKDCGLHAVQLHGNYDAAAARGLRGSVAVWRALAMPGEAAQAREWAPVAERFVLDSTGPGGASGGTGRVFDWGAARKLLRSLGAAPASAASLVAGGLAPNNVASALALSGAAGADVSSGVERRPGHKNPERVDEFCRVAHRQILEVE